jgi:hypothetical protein
MSRLKGVQWFHIKFTLNRSRLLVKSLESLVLVHSCYSTTVPMIISVAFRDDLVQDTVNIDRTMQISCMNHGQELDQRSFVLRLTARYVRRIRHKVT